MADFTPVNPDETPVPKYEEMSEIKPPRADTSKQDSGDSLEEDFGEHSGSLKKRMELSPKMSDFQVVDKRLFPILKDGVEWLNNLMVARVFPEEVIPTKSIITKHLLGEYSEMSFAEAFTTATVASSVPLDSEGRIDIARVYVKAGEVEEEKAKKEI